MKLDLAQLLAAARLAADRAAAYLREQEGTLPPEAWAEKRPSDFVTAIDRTAERIIAEILLREAPASRVVGEELTPDDHRDGLTWIVDPLDGTTNYLHRFPFYAVSIAAVLDGEPLAGVVVHVSPGIRYHAVRGGGAWQDDRRIHVSAVTAPRLALIGTGFPYSELEHLALYQRQFAAVVAGSGGVRRPGSAALDLCDVAAGRFDGFWEYSLHAWDMAGGALLVEEAGGRVTKIDGSPFETEVGSICAANPALHGPLVQALASSRAHPANSRDGLAELLPPEVASKIRGG